MAVEYTLLMQKTTDGSEVKSSLSDFGFAVCEIPWPDEETQEVSVRIWPGEHGEDAYIPPSGLKLQAYDVEVELCYKGDVHTAYTAYTALRNYLIGANGDGAELRIYDPYWRKGRTGVRVKKIPNADPHRSNVDEVLPMKVTFRVTDPITEITLTHTPAQVDMPIQISLRTDGANLYIDTSRALEQDEVPVLLTRCVRRNTSNRTSHQYRSKNRWHVADPFPQRNGIASSRMADNGRIDVWSGLYHEYRPLAEKLFRKQTDMLPLRATVYRGHKANYFLNEHRNHCQICFGIAVYKPNFGAGNRPVRKSNVAYFRVEHKIEGNDVTSRFMT